MEISRRALGFIKLGLKISSLLKDEKKNLQLNTVIQKSYQQNAWFTEDNVRYALSAVSDMIQEKNVMEWLSAYPTLKSQNLNPRSIGVIMPSNIPLAGFHDFFCVLMSGNIFSGKCSSQDKILLPFLAELLMEIEPDFKMRIRFTENRLEGMEAIIATGSNNSARYFEYYFGKYPHIIRKNRNSIAVLDGSEDDEELKLLGEDVFRYFGLGCRNISKLFVPENYDFSTLFHSFYSWQNLIHHHKYGNNYTFNKALYLMNKIKIWDNGFLLLKEEVGMSSPVAVLFYEYYKEEKSFVEKINADKERIQCIVSAGRVGEQDTISFGKAQQPELWEYADGVDTMEFLMKMSDNSH